MQIPHEEGLGIPVGRRLSLAGLGQEMQTRPKAVASSSCNREGETFWGLGGMGLPWAMVSGEGTDATAWWQCSPKHAHGRVHVDLGSNRVFLWFTGS